MLTVAEALAIVVDAVKPLTPRATALADALGCVAAEEATSDVDSPPHDKSIVDGYALRFDDLQTGKAELHVIEEVTAGRVPTRTVDPGTAVRIMTGAPLPAGADAVVMVEKTSQPTADRVAIDDPRTTRNQNIVRRGTSMRRGDVVLRPGTLLNPIHIGLLAEVGRAHIQVTPRPTVAVLATGDELVEPHETPAAGQIRNSNESMLAALATRCGGIPRPLGIARDDRDSLRQKIAAGLQSDVLILSGGVSAGVLDLVPSVLTELGVGEVFHKVSVKPGKPLWFGLFTSSDGATRPVFGLPGNPVSSLVCFELFVRPALNVLRGVPSMMGQATRPVTLGAEFHHRGDRPTYWPARAEQRDDGEIGVPLKWSGSGDLRALADADGLLCFPPGDRRYEPGEPIPFRTL